MRSKPVDWLYRASTGWHPLPEWAGFFLGLGSTVASIADGSTRAVVAVTTPTRSFAAPLCAVGVVVEHSRTEVSVDPAMQVAYLRTLAPGTAVSFRTLPTGSKKGRGILRGFESQRGEEYIVIETPNYVEWMPAREADRVEPLVVVPQKAAARMRFTRVNLNAGLMNGLLSPDQVAAFLGYSRLHCAVVGNRSLLRDELLEAPFAIGSGKSDRIEGHLQNVVRARAFLRAGESYRSDVVSVASRVLPARLASLPSVAIFDGSRSFLRWNSSYPSANWIIILDRADRRLTEAIDVVDALYASRVGDQASLTVRSAPIGIECAVFDTRRGPP